ncbi:PTB domain-containing adapter protein ced-6 isoform X2 [Anoplophora glabripennis]|nr:PTB domain-containing adapter protein ced-6 isoform X2 [Anoplophora glabripennis]XP_018564461.1 PTB domain-containing adapter protein ced-6 isoform X2 [Anoplophora glabripennis]
MSTLLKWAQNTQGKLNGKNSSNNNSSTNGERKWIHPPEALQKGHIAYLVKFLGNTVVDQPKGIEVVKEGIRKLRFSQQLRKSETGAKTRKVELTISIDGVAIQEPRTHNILHQFPLHRISYCADDKGEKKFFSFIAKQPNQVDNEAEDTHECFVFISDKLAEEITLTIGQAFELAYKRFLETSGKDLESQRRAMITQQKIKRLEQENNVYKQRLLEISQFSSIRPELDQYLRKNDIRNILEVKSSLNNNSNSSSDNTTVNNSNQTNGTTKELLDLNSEITNGAPPVPPRSFENTPAVGTKLEGLLLNELEHDNDFDPRSFENNHNTQFYPNTNGNTSSPPLIAPPPKAPRRSNLSLNTNNGNNNGDFKTSGQDLFGTTPFTPALTPSPNSVTSGKILDPFEMGDFGNAATPQDLENAIGLLDKRILEMKTGFSRGISFGNDDFSLESLDPLKN